MKRTCAPGRASVQAQRPSRDRAGLSARAPGPAPVCACAESRAGGRVARAPGSGLRTAAGAAGRWASVRHAGDGAVRPALGHRQRRLGLPGGLRAVGASAVVGWHPDAVPHAQREAGLPGGCPAQQLPDCAPCPPGGYHRHRVGHRVCQHESWLIIASTMLTILIVFDPLGGKAAPGAPLGPQPLDSRESNQLLSGLKTAATSVWETRVRLLCCCVGRDDHTRVAFSSTAELFSTYFSDTDLVPSDIAAGLALLHQQQDHARSPPEPTEVVTHSPGPFQEADLDAELENCHHYMQFAAAAYGWPLYVYRNPFTGLCRVGGDCCRRSTTDYDLVGGDQLNCHFSSILRTTGLQHRDFIHISFHDKVYELPFLVALDHRKESVVVAVRGTMSLQDILTDLSAESEPLDLECEVQDCWAHKGISQAARYVYRRLVNDGILSQAFSIAPEYRLVVVGHSLGAGAAALLALMLKSSHPQVRCYAFSPPRGLLSKSLYEYSKTFIVSLVLGKDVIPRLSVANLEDLKRRILRVIAHCNKPKYKILLRGCWYELFGGSPEDLPTDLDGGDLTQPLLGEHSLLVHGSPAYSFSSESPLESPTKYPPLYPPGRIIHLEEEGASGSCSCSPAARYTVRWAHESEFSRILIGPKMLTDHMPDVLMRVLDHVVSDRTACVSCPAQGGSSVDQA
ncbi:diacylglycerol lipase-beta isoform X2 [Ovis canadensis]|uniref:diacylglycerol lipase-beta isoform X2 n=1 Tax=Ovis canadensis TaxID=37174 RepID=UPI003750FAE7